MPASARVDACMKPSWTTFVAAAQGVLEAAGMYEPRPDTSELMAGYYKGLKQRLGRLPAALRSVEAGGRRFEAGLR